MERWGGKSAVVSGAASGIGHAIAAALLKKNVNVLALDTDAERLASIDWRAPEFLGDVLAVHGDVSDEQDVERAFSKLEHAWTGGVDILINNAGVVNYTRVIDSDRKTFEKLLNTNVLGYAELIGRAVRSMRQREVEGHIFNINSVLGHEIPRGFMSKIDGCNGWNLYPTCKHATVALTHTVRRELAAVQAPIRITSICPGIVDTDIAKGTPAVTEVLRTIPALRPEDVADAVIYALGTRPEVEISELTIRCTGETADQ